MKNKKRLVILGVIVIAALWMFRDSFTQPGVQDLRGGFEERAFIRNENNTGPVERLYAVALQDTLWAEMEQYGNYMPHTKYGSTKVYFFRKDQPVPAKLHLGKENIDEQFKPYCLGLYEKDAMSQAKLVKYPFR